MFNYTRKNIYALNECVDSYDFNLQPISTTKVKLILFQEIFWEIIKYFSLVAATCHV